MLIRKIMCITLFCLMISSITPIYSIYRGSLVVSSVNLETENIVEVSVSIRDNPGIAAFLLKLDFDNSKLLPVSIAKGTVLSKGSFVSNVHQGGDLSALEVVTAYWVNTMNATVDGVLYTVKFKVLRAVGNADFKVSYTPNHVSDQNYNNITLSIENDVIQIGNEAFVTDIISNNIKQSGNTIDGSLSVRITNSTNNTKRANVIMAIYNDAGRLVAIMTKYGEEFNQGNNFLEFTDINISNATQNHYRVETLLWDGDLTPLSLPDFGDIGG